MNQINDIIKTFKIYSSIESLNKYSNKQLKNRKAGIQHTTRRSYIIPSLILSN